MNSRKQHLEQERRRSLEAFDAIMGGSMARVEQLHGVPLPSDEPVPTFITVSGGEVSEHYLEEPSE